MEFSGLQHGKELFLIQDLTVREDSQFPIFSNRCALTPTRQCNRIGCVSLKRVHCAHPLPFPPRNRQEVSPAAGAAQAEPDVLKAAWAGRILGPDGPGRGHGRRPEPAGGAGADVGAVERRVRPGHHDGGLRVQAWSKRWTLSCVEKQKP